MAQWHDFKFLHFFLVPGLREVSQILRWTSALVHLPNSVVETSEENLACTEIDWKGENC